MHTLDIIVQTNIGRGLLRFNFGTFSTIIIIIIIIIMRTDDYRIGIVSEPILGVSYRIVSATVVSADITHINAGSSTVDGSHYTR